MMKIAALLTLTVFLSGANFSRAASVNKVERNVVSMEIPSAVDTPPVKKQLREVYRSNQSASRASTLKAGDTSNGDSDAFGSAIFTKPNDAGFNVRIDLQKAVNTIGSKFVGATLDSSVFRRKWKNVDVHSPALQALIKGLGPSLFRVGGTAADFFIFTPSPRGKEEVADTPNDNSDSDDSYSDYDYDSSGLEKPRKTNYTVTGEEWERVNYLVQVAGWDLIFDFNEFLRQDGQWNSDNARQLLAFSQQRNYSIPCFQLGNEPNSYYHNFQFRIEPAQLAKDMKKLRSLLSEFPAYKDSYILGPDVTKVTQKSGRDYLRGFLTSGGQDVVAAATLHHYYISAKSQAASITDFTNPTILNTLKAELSIGTNISRSLAPSLPVWLSETSSVSGGGLPGVSTAYVAGFMWLDKLGLSAQYGLKAVLRQCLYNGNYALISEDFQPYPDYFLTVLFKRLVQGPVFNVSTSTDTVRVYAACANPALYPRGALTVYVLNVQNRATTVRFPLFSNQSLALYLLTPGDGGGLRSPYVALNGEQLVMLDNQLPPMPARVQAGPVTFPAYSFGFVVIPQADVQLCKGA